MSSGSQPKVRMSAKLASGDYLTLSVWNGKSDPTAEIITVQIRHLDGDIWTTAGKLAAYRTPDGRYSQLPERRQ